MTSINRYNPLGTSLLSRRDEFVTSFDQIFNAIFSQTFPNATTELGVDLFSKGAYPKVNIINEESEIIFEVEIPGLAKDQIHIEVDKEYVLTIRGEKQAEVKNKNRQYLFRELKQSSFVRSFSLNDTLDVDNIKAKFENGILILHIPKKIPIKNELSNKSIKIE